VQFGAKRRGTIRRIGFLCCLVQAVQAVSVQLGAKRRGAIRKIGFCAVWCRRFLCSLVQNAVAPSGG